MRTATVVFALALPAAAQNADDVAAVFQKNCIGCHSGAAKMGGLDLENSASLHKGGAKGAVIVAGKSEQSRLYLMMAGKLQPSMPVGGKVTAAELEAVKAWIDTGAKGEYTARVASAPQIKSKAPAKAQIFSLAYSPDGKLVAVGGYKEVRLLDASGKPVASLTGPAEVVRSVAFSKDGRRIAAVAGNGS